MLDLYDEIISYCAQIKDAISNVKSTISTIKINYLNQFHSDINQILVIFRI